jgi:tRNA G46 methylase TrmB
MSEHKRRQRLRRKLRPRALAADILLGTRIGAVSQNIGQISGPVSSPQPADPPQGKEPGKDWDWASPEGQAELERREAAARGVLAQNYYTEGLCGPSSEKVVWERLPAEVDPARSGGSGLLSSSAGVVVAPARENYSKEQQQEDASITSLEVSGRALRKRWQIESFAEILRDLVSSLGEESITGRRQPLRVCDMGCGSGNFSLALASLFPGLDFTLVDRNAVSVEVARQRAAAAGLSNAKNFVSASIESLGTDDTAGVEIDVVIAMHACGLATDAAISTAVALQVPFVVCPCCVGKLKDGEGGPRSSWLKEMSVTRDEFLGLAATADHVEADSSEYQVNLAKVVVELDRSYCASERGYEVLMGKLHPLDSSPKNDVLIGAPPGSTWSNLVPTLRARSEIRARIVEAQRPRMVAPRARARGTTRENQQQADPNRGCSFFVKRKQRTCRLMATDGSEWCSNHQPEALAKERLRSVVPGSANPHSAVIPQYMIDPFRGNDGTGQIPDWRDVFHDPTLPLMIDLGCGSGRCIEALADDSRHEGRWNFLGVDIVSPLIDASNARLSKLFQQGRTKNAHFLTANVLERDHFSKILVSLRDAAGSPVVAGICVQFPDPWMKSKHQRKRLVGPGLVSELATSNAIRRNCWVYVSSDVRPVVDDARSALSAVGFLPVHQEHRNVTGLTPLPSWEEFPPSCDRETSFLDRNPLGADAPTERERSCEMNWRTVFRTLLSRTSITSTPSSDDPQ